MTNPYDPPDEFFIEMAKDCRCCPDCAQVPCPGVCAGGLCDGYCRCDDERDYGDDDWDEDELCTPHQDEPTRPGWGEGDGEP